MSYSVKRIQSGFTLIEAIVVIVATAVIVGFIALSSKTISTVFGPRCAGR